MRQWLHDGPSTAFVGIGDAVVPRRGHPGVCYSALRTTTEPGELLHDMVDIHFP